MARPRQDGTPAREANRRKLTDLFVSSRKPQERAELIWDVKQPGLALSVRTTGKKAWKVIYRFHGRPRWLHLGDVRSIGLADARRLAARIMLDVIEGKDPAAERKAERMTGTFADLAASTSSCTPRSTTSRWKQAERLVDRHLLPRWGKLKASAITRADVRAMMLRIDAPIVANQTLAAASAIFSWAIRQEILTVNPCKRSTAIRPRTASASSPTPRSGCCGRGSTRRCKLILLTGQRPGEVAAMQRDHIADGWWQLPGKPQGAWPGTKNGRDHRVWLSEPAQALIERHLAETAAQGRARR